MSGLEARQAAKNATRRKAAQLARQQVNATLGTMPLPRKALPPTIPYPPAPPRPVQLIAPRKRRAPIPVLSMPDIVAAVCLKYGLRHCDVVGPRRLPRFSKARQVAIYIIRRTTDLDWPTIGKYFNRDHSTAIYSYQKAESELFTDNELCEDIRELYQSLIADA